MFRYTVKKKKKTFIKVILFSAELFTLQHLLCTYILTFMLMSFLCYQQTQLIYLSFKMLFKSRTLACFMLLSLELAVATSCQPVTYSS